MQIIENTQSDVLLYHSVRSESFHFNHKLITPSAAGLRNRLVVFVSISPHTGHMMKTEVDLNWGFSQTKNPTSYSPTEVNVLFFRVTKTNMKHIFTLMELNNVQILSEQFYF